MELIDPDKIRVYQPTHIIFICGGKTDAAAHPPLSLRDAFMRIAFSPPFTKYQPMLAEELDAFFPKGDYKDFLSLESDIAQISTLVLLFSESEPHRVCRRPQLVRSRVYDKQNDEQIFS
ncbi:hypothetical protein [Rhizobium terrae]|uniref:hypothetical protein n=1 Tax=Rhizobium terrae TaxID=2171756 RepID=UPI0013C36136|nr:hypothetical protein [Rhizobium terrae]